VTTAQDSGVVGAHLVGSVPLSSSDEVFQYVGEELGRHVKRIPDGETGERAGWAGWAAQIFYRTEGLEPSHPFYLEISPRQIGLADGRSADDIHYAEIGQADAALASYEQFARRKRDGEIAADVRFLVSLPTPLALVASAVVESDFAALEPGFEAAQRAEFQRIFDGIPHSELAIQWDVCIEVWFQEGWVRAQFDAVEDGITERLKRYSDWVPTDVELGYHFCYGDYMHAHLQQPDDCRACVELFNRIVDIVDRPIAWVHIPVPIDRDDDAYFAPLDDLQLPADTELYLGLVHFRDGAEGAQRRIAAAKRHVPAFGVATECGMGRRSPERGGGGDGCRQLLRLHADVSAPVRG